MIIIQLNINYINYKIIRIYGFLCIFTYQPENITYCILFFFGFEFDRRKSFFKIHLYIVYTFFLILIFFFFNPVDYRVDRLVLSQS